MATRQLDGFLRRLRTATLQHHSAGVSDAQLLESFIARTDEAAFAALVRRHGPMVLGVCRRVLGHVQDAEDAFQATFLVLVRRAASIVPRAMVGNWLYGVAYRTALRARETAARRRSKERQVATLPEPEAPQPDLWHDLQPLLDGELDRLPAPYRAAVVLCDLEGQTHKEAARQLGWPVGTLSTRLTRARAMLAKRLAQRGVALSGGALAAVISENVAAAGVPPPVVASTIKAASLFAAGQAARGVISVQVSTLAGEVLKAMWWTKLKTATVILLGLAVLGSGIGLSYHRLQAADPVAASKDAPAPANKRADGQVALKTARLAAAKKAYEAIWGEYQVGRHDEEVVYRWSLRLLESQRATAEAHADEIKAFEAHLSRMKKLEAVAPDRVVIVPVERIEPDGKPKLGIGFTKDGERSGAVATLGLRSPHAAETTAFFRAEAEWWLAEAKTKRPG